MKLKETKTGKQKPKKQKCNNVQYSLYITGKRKGAGQVSSDFMGQIEIKELSLQCDS